MLVPTHAAELAAFIKEGRGPFLPVGGGTKPTLWKDNSATLVSMKELRGIVEYEPSEYTFTALAGTPVADIAVELARHGQYLPFDPLLVTKGTTLGGCIAANANGPGRVRYGGVRDFIIGVRFVNGLGDLIRGGGKVVKNAAGFDFPKLFCGSAGRLGILTEVSFKVFPLPEARCSVELSCADLAEALRVLQAIAAKSWEAEAVELLPPNKVMLRLMGAESAMEGRLRQIFQGLGRDGKVLEKTKAEEFWREANELAWMPESSAWVRIPVTSGQIPALDAALGEVPRRYSFAANAAFVAWPGDPAVLSRTLTSLGLAGVVWQGAAPPWLGKTAARATDLVKNALDPNCKFPPFAAA